MPRVRVREDFEDGKEGIKMGEKKNRLKKVRKVTYRTSVESRKYGRDVWLY